MFFESVAGLRAEFLPAFAPEGVERGEVAFVDAFGGREGAYGCGDAVFAQEVERGVGGAVGEVAEVVGGGVGELVVGMKAGDLKHSGEPGLAHGCLGAGEEALECEKSWSTSG